MTKPGFISVRQFIHEFDITLHRIRMTLQIAARKKVLWALKEGKLVRRPCEVCCNPRAHAHHFDYAKQLDVLWLCPKHHTAWHATQTPTYPSHLLREALMRVRMPQNLRNRRRYQKMEPYLKLALAQIAAKLTRESEVSNATPKRQK